ncbi:hypothetical protein [Sulfurimonas sp.]
MNIKYIDRCWKSDKNKFYYIQPFSNIKPNTKNIELVLDNCAFAETINNSSALLGASVVPGLEGIGINPLLAFIEQWLSNPSFYEDKHQTYNYDDCKMIDKFTNTCSTIGIHFTSDYNKKIFQSLKAYESEARYNLGIIFGVVAYLKVLIDEKSNFDTKLEKWLALTNDKYPKFSALLILGVCAIFFQSNRSKKFIDTNKHVYGYFDSFLAYKKKEEKFITEGFLRNRAADLYFWYAFPQIYKNIDNFYESEVFPIAVTADKFVANIPFKLIPFTFNPNSNDSRFEVQFVPDSLDNDTSKKIMDILESINFTTKQNKTVDEKKKSLKELYMLALSSAGNNEKKEILETWEAWLGYKTNELQS